METSNAEHLNMTSPNTTSFTKCAPKDQNQKPYLFLRSLFNHVRPTIQLFSSQFTFSFCTSGFAFLTFISKFHEEGRGKRWDETNKQTKKNARITSNSLRSKSKSKIKKNTKKNVRVVRVRNMNPDRGLFLGWVIR
jgi:hypothetical protein